MAQAVQGRVGPPQLAQVKSRVPSDCPVSHALDKVNSLAVKPLFPQVCSIATGCSSHLSLLQGARAWHKASEHMCGHGGGEVMVALLVVAAQDEKEHSELEQSHLLLFA